jgi:hypothetical protein
MPGSPSHEDPEMMHEILLCVLWYPVGMWWLEWFVPFPFNALIVGAVFQLYIAAKLFDDRRIFHRPDAWEAFIMRLIVLVVIGVLVAAAFWALGIPHWVLETRRSTGMA